MTRGSLVFPLIALAAFGVGVFVGWQIRFVESIPNMTALFAWFIAAVGWGLVLLLGIIALVVLAFRRTRAGTSTLGVAGALAVGLLTGHATGSEWRYPVETQAQVELELDAPISKTFVATGICRTIENGDRIVAVQASPIVRVGADPMSLLVWLARSEEDDDRINLVGYRTEGRLAGYRTGPSTKLTIDTNRLQLSGSGTFTGLEAEGRGEPLGGPDGPRLLDGRFSWTCEEPS